MKVWRFNWIFLISAEILLALRKPLKQEFIPTFGPSPAMTAPEFGWKVEKS